MTKVSFNKLKITTNNNIIPLQWGDNVIEVKEYLPVEEKFSMLEEVIGFSMDSNKFYNTLKLDIFTAIKVVEYYTNITFTEKQKEKPQDIYDALISSGLYNKIVSLIGEEINSFIAIRDELVKAIYNYENSIFGILDSISRDYKDFSVDVEGLKKALAEREGLEFLNEVLTKLG